jgi:CDP-diglyceride synthetase
MGQRFLYGFSLFFALVGLLAADHALGVTWGFFALCVGMTLAGLREVHRMLRWRGLPLDAPMLAVFTVAVLLYIQLVAEPPRLGALGVLWVGDPEYAVDVPYRLRQLTLLLPLLAAVLFPLFALRKRDVPNISARLLNNLGVLLYLVLPIAVILWLRRVPETGAWLLYFLLAASRLGDVGAYLIGSAIGRHKLIPWLSPGKSVEGALAGLAFSALGGVLIWLWGNWATGGALRPVLAEWWAAALLGAFLGIAAQAGDLVESAFKRAAGVKDSGRLVPTFGGVMDIMDNFMLTGPLLLILLVLWSI